LEKFLPIASVGGKGGEKKEQNDHRPEHKARPVEPRPHSAHHK